MHENASFDNNVKANGHLKAKESKRRDEIQIYNLEIILNSTLRQITGSKTLLE